ncbi:Ubiquitin-specific protease family C19-related protein [Zostera marina]|uniref:Ubiquitin-specific protease family C19-related protein n=1 Tax=Zostera marina TaxID=29655 RepID=A0A0K9PGH1_ZOSMR|nr:Ubiquitin-specific protease family C19-related protein [Zostera marina]
MTCHINNPPLVPNPAPPINDLSCSFYHRHRHPFSFYFSLDTIPSTAIYILIPLFFIGFAVSIFILITVHNAILLVSFLFLFAIVVCFLFWNSYSSLRNGALVHFVDRFPNSDLGSAKEGQIVKVTGLVSCENHSLESSYERVSRCVYTSTLLYECGGFQSKPISNFKFKRNLVHIERSVVDLYVTDAKSGLRVTVKAGYGSEVIPLINESTLVNTSSKNMILSSTLIKWLGERDLTADARMLCLEEGYVKEGSSLTVMGMLTRHDGILMIVPPPEFISTGCFVQKLLFPMEINGITLSTPNNVNSTFSNVRPPQFC